MDKIEPSAVINVDGHCKMKRNAFIVKASAELRRMSFIRIDCVERVVASCSISRAAFIRRTLVSA